jgi:hypothetical protein
MKNWAVSVTQPQHTYMYVAMRRKKQRGKMCVKNAKKKFSLSHTHTLSPATATT